MFCPYCGANLVDNASFCMTCGKQISPSSVTNPPQPQNPVLVDAYAQQYQAQKNAIRQSEISGLSDAISHFSQKTAQFRAYDYVCEQLNYYARGAKSALLVWGCIISTFVLFICLNSIGDGDSGTQIASVPLLVLGLIPGLVMIVGGIFMKINNHKKLAHFQNKYAELSQELNEHYLAYPNCPAGSEYANPEILQVLLDVLQSGRADTVKESINLIIDAKRQARVHNYLATIERNTAKTKATVIFAAAAFFRR